MAGCFKERGVLGASFFFKRGERDRQDAALFFTTLATQLASTVPPVAPHVRSAVRNDPAISSKALREQFDKLVLRPLNQLGGNPETPSILTIVVDALDECNRDNDIRLLIHLFSRSKSLEAVRLKVFITSRPELPIRLGFNDIRGIYEDVALHQIPEPIIEHNIAVFLGQEFRRIRDDHNYLAFDSQQLPSDWPGEDVIQTLVRMAIPLFIFAATMCRFIKEGSDPASRLRKFRDYQTTDDSEFDKLEATYLPVLSQLVVNGDGAGGVQDIVGPIVLLAEPLSAQSLSQLLDIPLTSIDGTLRHLHSVLSVPSTANAPIRTFHLSFRDFLIDPKKGRNKVKYPFSIDERETHRRLATWCLQLLSTNNTLKRDVCSLRYPGTCRSEINQATINVGLPPEVQYSCRYWVYHWKKSECRVRDSDLADRFLSQHLLHWLEALGLLGQISESIRMIDDLIGLLDVGSSLLSRIIY